MIGPEGIEVADVPADLAASLVLCLPPSDAADELGPCRTKVRTPYDYENAP